MGKLEIEVTLRSLSEVETLVKLKKLENEKMCASADSYRPPLSDHFFISATE
jgi:hypothetical protein